MTRPIESRRSFLFMGLAALPILKSAALADNCPPTAANGAGPFYRKGAPWRASLCGANEPGRHLILDGRVIEAGTCRPLKGATLDVWQANAAGRYDNDDPRNPPDPNKYLLRGQLKTDEKGYYRIETVLPGSYQAGNSWRAKHIHYIVSSPGYSPLTTQCYFEGDKHNKTDFLVKESLIISLSGTRRDGSQTEYLKGAFDVVLAKA